MLKFAAIIVAYVAVGFISYVGFSVKARLTPEYTPGALPDKGDWQVAAAISSFAWPLMLPLIGFITLLFMAVNAIAKGTGSAGHPVDRLVNHIASGITARAERKEKLLQEEQERRETKPVADTVDYRTVKNEEKFGLVHSKPRKKFVRDYATNGFGPQ